MKLSLRLHVSAIKTNVYIVDWNDQVLNFPKTVKLGDAYFEWQDWDPGSDDGADFKLEFCLIQEYALPRNMFNQLFPVSDLKEMFGIGVETEKQEDKNKSCDCGEESIGGTKHSTWCKSVQA
jgi:hypothetical protein